MKGHGLYSPVNAVQSAEPNYRQRANGGEKHTNLQKAVANKKLVSASSTSGSVILGFSLGVLGAISHAKFAEKNQKIKSLFVVHKLCCLLFVSYIFITLASFLN